jgi:TonB family protein
VHIEIHTPLRQLDDVHNARHIWLAVLAALILHALVVLGFRSTSFAPPSAQRQTIDVSLEASTLDTPPVTEKRPTPPKPQPLPEPPPPTEAPAPKIAETPPPPETSAAPAANAPTQNNTPPSEEIQPLFRLTRMPSFARKIEAVYPASERRAGIQANVLAEVTIDSQGKVLTVRILKSGGPTFDEAVKEALQKSTFNPGMIDGKPVGTRFQVPFRFNLN